MATTAKGKKGGAPVDPKAKIKLIVASAILGIALVWIAIWTMSSGDSGSPNLSATEIQQVEEQQQQQIKKIREENLNTPTSPAPPAPPAGS